MKKNTEVQKIVIDEYLVRDVQNYVLSGKEEYIAAMTGPVADSGDTVVTTFYEIETEEQSAVYALGSVESCRESFLDMIDKGFVVRVLAHSHPGFGPQGCMESSTDTGYLRPLQESGSNCIGLIFSRDGYFHFFTVKVPFEIEVHGKNIKTVEEEGMSHVYKLED